jgi:hypothetical protein
MLIILIQGGCGRNSECDSPSPESRHQAIFYSQQYSCRRANRRTSTQCHRGRFVLLPALRQDAVLSNLYFTIEWNPSTLEDALANPQDPILVYCISKTLAERALWKFSEEHPDINITTRRLLHHSVHDELLNSRWN